MAIEANFDVPFIAAMALKEKQIQQNYRPIIAVHKWFARRPGTLFRGLVVKIKRMEPLSRAALRLLRRSAPRNDNNKLRVIASEAKQSRREPPR